MVAFRKELERSEPRRQRGKVTEAELGRVANFLRTLGAKVATIDLSPGQIKIVTTEGQNITLDSDEAALDQELHSYRQERDKGST